MTYLCSSFSINQVREIPNINGYIMETSMSYTPIMTVNKGEPKDYVNHSVTKEPKYKKDFIEFIIETVNRKKRRNSPSYVGVYSTLINHLRKFCAKYNVVLYVESINEDFLDDFITYLEECNCRINYIEHLLTLIRAMVSKAGKYSYVVDPTYDDVRLEPEDTFGVALSMNQITRIYYSDNITKCQRRVRDLFIVGALTGMRYSDYSTLDSSNVRGDFIVKTTKKTNKEVTVPIHDYIREIYERYDNSFPKATAIQNFNRQIKLICKRIGMDDPITYSYTKGRKRITVTYPLWKLVGSHTARRTAATILYESGRFPLSYIMQITGHTTEKSLRIYLKISQEDVAKRMNGDIIWKK